MKYRIEYTSFTPNDKAGGQHQENIIAAETDASALEQYEKFKKHYESSETFTRYLVHGLVRIDQEEITTRIL